MASMCEPVPTGASVGSLPSQRAKVLPTASWLTLQTRFLAQALHIRAGAHVRFAKDDARHHRRLGFGDLREGHQLGHQAVDR